LAQTNNGDTYEVQATPAEIAELNNLPSVEIKNISLPKDKYSAGEEVTGTFTLKNDKDYNLPDLKYTVSLAGEYRRNGLAGVIYDSKSYGPVFLKAGEMKQINFSYLLPTNFSGKALGIQIQFYTAAGMPLSWKDKFIEVTGDNSLLKVSDAYLTIGEKKYGLQEGPTLSPDKKGTLYINVENPFTTGQVLTPEIKIYDRTVSGNLITSYRLDPITISASTTKLFQWGISYLDKSGVYELSVDFLNSDAIKVTPTVLARYIVTGSVAAIQSVSLNKNILKVGDTYNFNMVYTGAPLDIDLGPTVKENPLNLFINILNENKEIVSAYSRKLDFNKGISLDISLKAKASAQNIFIDIKVTDDNDNIITTYTNEVTGNTQTTSKAIFYLLGVLSVIILSISVYIFRKRKEMKTILVFVLVLISSFLAFDSASANSVVWTSNTAYNIGGNVTTMTITAPQLILSPNEEFYITGSLSSYACSNAPQQLVIKRSDILQSSSPVGTDPYNKETYIINNGRYEGGGCEGFDCPKGWNSNNFSLEKQGASFIAPSTPGVYYILLQVDNQWYVPEFVEINWETFESKIWQTVARGKGYIKFTVVPPVEIRAKTSDVCDGFVILNWNSVPGITSYQVYKKNASGTVFVSTVTGISYELNAVIGDSFAIKPLITGVDPANIPFSNFATAVPSAPCIITPTPIPSPKVSCSANRSSAKVGQLVTWTAVATDGTAPYRYRFTDERSGLEMATTSSANTTIVYSTPGTYAFSVKVIDQANKESFSNCSNQVVVGPGLDVSCSYLGKSSYDENYGDALQWTASASNGDAPYTYTWKGDPTSLLNSLPGDSLNTVWQEYNSQTKTRYTVEVTATDSSSISASSTCEVVIDPYIPCAGKIPPNGIACSETITNVGGTWSEVFICPAIVSNCQYKTISAPSSLTAQATPGQCGGFTTLSWQPVTGVTGYKVYRGTETTPLVTTTVTSYTLLASTTDTFTVRSYLDTQESVSSNSVNGVPSAPCPVPVAGACSLPLVVNTCAIEGTFTNTEDTADTSFWTCNGQYGGASTTCSLPYPVLTVSKSGSSGTGLVTSTSSIPVTPVINCDADCKNASITVIPGADIILTANPIPGNTFIGWSGGGCSGTALTCTFTMSTTTTVFARFGLGAPNLTATTSASCGGNISLNWDAIPGAAGYHIYKSIDGVVFTPLYETPATSYIASSTGQYFQVKAVDVGQTESLASNSVSPIPSVSCTSTLTVTKIGTGTGTVSGGGISCGAGCLATSTSVINGTTVTLTATPTTGSAFVGWSGGGCSGTALTCTFTMSTTTTVFARFGLGAPNLTATTSASCGGNISLNWGTIPGAKGYNIYVSSNDVVFTLLRYTVNISYVASSTAGQTFRVKAVDNGNAESAFSSSATAVPSGPCTSTLTVTKTGTGTGTVSGGGVICGATCLATSTSVINGTTVTLTATSTAGHIFVGWQGGVCSGTALTCTFTMSTSTTVTAQFNLGAPTSLVATAAQCGGYTTLSWRPVPGTTGYKVYRGTETTPLVTTPVLAYTLLASTTDTFTVRSYLGTQESTSSSAVHGVPSAPCPPTTITAESAGQCGGYTTIRWSTVPGVTGYYVYKGTNRIATTTATSTTATSSATDLFMVSSYLGAKESALSVGVFGAPSNPCNPACGTVADEVRPAGIDRSTPPDTAEEKCQVGIASAINGDANGPWNWTCTEVTSSVTCTVTPPPVPPPAYCGTFNATTTAIAPSTNEEKCRVGIPSDITGGIDAPWTWTCSSAGYVSSCSTTFPAAPLLASCSVSPSTAAIGETVTWTATPTGGVGDYTYSWVGPNLTGNNSAAATTSYSEADDYYGQVTVTDQDANEYTVSCDNHVTITPDPTVSCSGTRYYDDPLNIPSGKISWLATSYNTGNPNYFWNGDLSSTSATFLQNIVTGTTKYIANIKVIDSVNNKTATSSCEIQTNGVDGTCGVPKDTCPTGDFVDVADEGATYKWDCNGRYGGLNAQCSACMDTPTEPANTYCGSANGTARTTAPNTDTEKCDIGTASAVVGGSTGPWTWSCSNNCYVSTCSASAVVVPETATLSINRVGPGIVSDATTMILCGPAATDCVVTFPVGTTIALTATPDSGASFQGWSGGGCTGTGGCGFVLNTNTTINATFTPPPVVYPSCGSANGTTRTTAPSTLAEKCSIGTSGVVSDGTDSWSWTCANQGNEVSCSATKSGTFTVSCTVAPATVLTGDTVTWTATSTGGVGAYTYSWAGTNLTGKNTAIVTTSYATAGTYYGIATITRGTETSSANCVNSASENNVIVRDHLTASCSVTPATALTGQTVTWTATSTGGIGAYTYLWAGTNINGATTSVVNTSYTSVKNYTATSTINSGTETLSAGCPNLSVTTPPSPTCTDGQKNGNETDVDCGGSCPACEVSCTENCGGNPDEGDYCSSTAGECIGGATPSQSPYISGDWTCTKGTTISYCSGVPGSDLSCTVELTSPSSPIINRGSNSLWTATVYGPDGTYQYSWYIINRNNPITVANPHGTPISGSSTDNTYYYFLRTTGLNTVTAKVTDGTKVAYCSNNPSVTVVESGGSNSEF
jgi:hypothetical protein